MADISYTRMKNRGGVGLTGKVEPHIFREPKKAIQTRKYEPVSEQDIMYMTRPDAAGSDPTRINENIRQVSAGINPSVKMDYTGRGGGSRTTHLHNNAVGSVYKLEVVRPPLFPVETTNSLSNPRTHQNVSIFTNPQALGGGTIADQIDVAEILNPIQVARVGGPETLQSIPSYKLTLPATATAVNHAIDDQTLQYRVDSALSGLAPYFQERDTEYGVILEPLKPELNVNSSGYTRGIADENHFANDATREVLRKSLENPNLNLQWIQYFTGDKNNTTAKVKDILVKSLKTHNLKLDNPGTQATQGDVKIKLKDILVRSLDSPMNFSLIVYSPENQASIDISASIREKQNIAVTAAMNGPITLTAQDGRKIRLKDYKTQVVNSAIGLPQVVLTITNPDIKLERNSPLYALETGKQIDRNLLNLINPELKLQQKIDPKYTSALNLSNNYIAPKRELVNNKFTPKLNYDATPSSIPQRYAQERVLPTLNSPNRGWNEMAARSLTNDYLLYQD